MQLKTKGKEKEKEKKKKKKKKKERKKERKKKQEKEKEKGEKKEEKERKQVLGKKKKKKERKKKKKELIDSMDHLLAAIYSASTLSSPLPPSSSLYPSLSPSPIILVGESNKKSLLNHHSSDTDSDMEESSQPKKKATSLEEFHCQLCDRKFVRAGHYDRHMRVHTGEKPYICLHPTCGKTFSRSDNMMQHFKCHSSGGYICKREIKVKLLNDRMEQIEKTLMSTENTSNHCSQESKKEKRTAQDLTESETTQNKKTKKEQEVLPSIRAILPQFF